MFEMGAIDISIFILYIPAVMAIGFFAGRRKNGEAEDFFLARGKLPWFAVGFAMVATSISTEQFIGASAKAYDVGMAVLITDLLDCGDLAAALDRLGQDGREVCILHVHSPHDAGEGLQGPLLLEEAETGRRLVVAAGPELLAEYRRHWRDFQDHCRRICLARQAVYVPCRTEALIEKLVLVTLKAAGVVE